MEMCLLPSAYAIFIVRLDVTPTAVARARDPPSFEKRRFILPVRRECDGSLSSSEITTIKHSRLSLTGELITWDWVLESSGKLYQNSFELTNHYAQFSVNELYSVIDNEKRQTTENTLWKPQIFNSMPCASICVVTGR